MNRWISAVLLVLGLLSTPAQANDADQFSRASAAQQIKLLHSWTLAPELARLPLLTALSSGKVQLDSAKHAFLVQAGQTQALGSAASPTGSLRKLRLNNRLRGLLQVAEASHALLGDDLAARRSAAALLQRKARAEHLPLLQARLDHETDANTRDALLLALANLQLVSADPQIRLNAVERLGDSGEPQARAKLESLLAEGGEADPGVRAAAEQSLSQVKWRLLWGELLGHAFSGLSLGSILLLAALGLAITYGLLGVINMAHGEMLMLGAYTTYVVQVLFKSWAPQYLALYPLAALPVAFVVTALIGMALERTVIRHLYGRPLETLLATWGISLMLIQLVRVTFGAQNVEVANPDWLSGGIQLLPNLVLPYNRIVIIGFAIAVVVFTWLLLTRTRLGLQVRAVTQNRSMADCCGVPTGRVDMLAFGLGSGIAGLGGVALSQVGNVGPDLGQSYIIDSFLVVVLGGVGQLAGSVMAAFGLGVVNKILEPQVGAVLGKILILLLIILFIQKRPQGLFALKGRVVE